jgi:sugar O-acyltransferase (sialic acid O-acetyltransferase NeuD family)
MGKSVKDLIIIGSGYHSRCVVEFIEELSGSSGPYYRILGFLDDNPELVGNMVIGYQILGPLSSARKYQSACFINGIYSLRNQMKIPQIIDRVGVDGSDRWPSIVHPEAWVSPRATIGKGVFIYPSAKIFNGSSLDDFVMVMPSALIGVSVQVGWGVSISANAVVGGDVTIGNNVYIGQGSSIQEGVTIGDRSIIGMGAKVRKDVQADSLVFDESTKILPGAELLRQITKF